MKRKKKTEPLTAQETHQLMKDERLRGRLEELNALRNWCGQQAEAYQQEAYKNPDRVSAARMSEQAAVLYRVRAAIFARIKHVEGREIPEAEQIVSRYDRGEDAVSIKKDFPDHTCPQDGFTYLMCPGCEAKVRRYVEYTFKDPHPALFVETVFKKDDEPKCGHTEEGVLGHPLVCAKPPHPDDRVNHVTAAGTKFITFHGEKKPWVMYANEELLEEDDLMKDNGIKKTEPKTRTYHVMVTKHVNPVVLEGVTEVRTGENTVTFFFAEDRTDFRTYSLYNIDWYEVAK